jgi:sialic acid synthase SpsE
MNVILEIGLNHFGKISHSERYINFFLKSNFDSITYQIQKEKFYKKFKFLLPLNYYKSVIEKVHKNNKRIGLAVADIKTCYEVAQLKFDFYKILSISYNDLKLIRFLLSFDKHIFISCGTAKNYQIKNLLKKFNSNQRKKINLIHTSFSYDAIDQNLKRIDFLKKIHPNISYGHHYKNALPLFLTQSFDIDNVFVYVKTKEKYNYPDNAHAFDLKKITDLKIILEECKKMIGSEKKINYINKILNEN